MGNDPINAADPSGLIDLELEFTKEIKINLHVDDNLSSAQQSAATNVFSAAASMSKNMEAAGTLPASYTSAISNLNGLSVSSEKSGVSNTGIFNTNIGELESVISGTQNFKSPDAAAAAWIGSTVGHDGAHQAQRAAGALASANGVPPVESPLRATFDARHVANERAAIQVQLQFIAGAPISPGARSNFTNFLTGITDEQLIQRYHGR